MKLINVSSHRWTLVVLLLAVTTFGQAQVLQNLPRLKVEGPYMVDPQGNRVALRGVNVTASPQQQYWDMGGEVATVKESIRRATENNRNGANLSSTLIRFAMYPNRWGQRCCNKPGENSTQKWTPAFQAEFEEYVDNKLDQYVQYCKQRGAYILIDMHYISDANPVIKTSLMNYWPYLAKKYKDSDWVLFGLFNEPIRVYDGRRWSYDWLSFRNWAQPVVDEIRNHSDNIVMVGGLSWSKIFNEGTATSVINRPIQGGNIVYDYHVYSPFYCKNGGQLNVQRLNQTIGETITKYPVLYGEFGWYGEPGCVAGHSGTCQSYGQPLKEWTDHPSRRQKISWTPWSYSHQSGPTMLTSSGQLTDCNAHGKFIRDWLWERRNSDIPCVNCKAEPNPDPEPTADLPRVGQTIWLQSRVTGQYVTVNDGLVYANGSSNTSQSEHFEITAASNGYVRLKSLATNQYVQVISGNPTGQLTAQGGIGDQTPWKMIAAAGDYIRFESLVNINHMMADNNGANKPVTSNGGTGEWAQFSWGEVQAPPTPENPPSGEYSGYYVLRNRASGLNLRNAECQSKPGTLVELYDGTGECAQWQVEDAGEGYYLLKNRQSGLYLNNKDCQGSGALLQLYEGTWHCSQWKLVGAGGWLCTLREPPRRLERA